MDMAASSAKKLFPVAPGATSAPTVPAKNPGQIKSKSGGSFVNDDIISIIFFTRFSYYYFYLQSRNSGL
jgi:hypothetical protein